MIRVNGLKTCDTCRKAVKALNAAGLMAELRDLRADPPSRQELEAWLLQFGEEALVNRKSRTWRDLDDATRALPPVDLLQAHAPVMKRPLIETGGQAYLGWTDAVKNALIG
ncbi:MAG: arsenate reductase family protein [Qingshengfaniella sp.]